MKRYAAVISVLAMLIVMMLTMASGVVSAATYTKGDCNLDGNVDMKDVLILRRYLAHIDVEFNMQVADCTDDGLCDMKDVLMIRKYIAHLITLGTIEIGGGGDISVPEDDPYPNGDTIDPVHPRINFMRDTGHTLGVWWWQTNVKDPTLTQWMELLQQNQVTEIYYESYTLLYTSEATREALHNFVQKAMSYGMRVAVLFDDKANVMDKYDPTGQKTYVDENGFGDIWMKTVEGYKTYKQTYPNDAVYALHCDIEPKGYAQIQQFISEFLEKEVQYARQQGIPVELDLPCGWENQGTNNMDRADKSTAPAYQIIAESCDTMVLMSYRDSVDKVYTLGYAPLQEASKAGTKLVFGFEFGRSGEVETVDFSDEDRYYAYNVIKGLMNKVDRKDWGCQTGLAIHSADGWYNLRETGGNKTFK